MSYLVRATLFGYICPPETGVYADLPEFEPEFVASVRCYKARSATYMEPAEDFSVEIEDIRYVDKTSMSKAESEWWIDYFMTEAYDHLLDKVDEY